MREIKFRGLGIFDAEWAYGGISNLLPESTAIIEKNYKHGEVPSAHVVDPKTVGQYTGLKDKNGTEIYDGDIYKRYDSIYVVIFYGFGFKCKQVYDSWLDKNVYNRNEISLLSEVDSGYCYEVIGNIYENPDLLESGKEPL